MRALYAFLLLAIAWPALTTATAWALGNATTDLTITGLILLARHRPHHSHRLITWLVGAGIATAITGHRPKPTNGPQIPA